MQQLINERPEGVLKFLQRQGVRKLGEFCVQVTALGFVTCMVAACWL